jgi:hypothetical protein
MSTEGSTPGGQKNIVPSAGDVAAIRRSSAVSARREYSHAVMTAAAANPTNTAKSSIDRQQRRKIVRAHSHDAPFTPSITTFAQLVPPG